MASFDEELLNQLSPVPRKGPLSKYREKATFNWRSFRVKFHGEEILQLKMSIWKTLETDPIFVKNTDESLKSKRESTFHRVKRLIELNLVPFEVG